MQKFLRSFKFATAGIIHCLKAERNFKIHVIMALLVIIAGIATKLSPIEWFIIIIFISGVLALELVNTALERIVDLVTAEHHLLAKQAKDAAAGAVLVFAIGSAIAGLIIFIPKWLLLFN